MEIFFSVPLFYEFTKLEENSLNKRSKIGTEISFVSKTENHLFVTRDLIDTIKTTPPTNTAFEGSFLTLELLYQLFELRTPRLELFCGHFYQILSMRFFSEKRKITKKILKENREVLFGIYLKLFLSI